MSEQIDFTYEYECRIVAQKLIDEAREILRTCHPERLNIDDFNRARVYMQGARDILDIVPKRKDQTDAIKEGGAE